MKRLLAAARHIPWYVVQLILSNWAVARAVMGLSQVQPHVVEVRRPRRSGLVLLSNGVTLTPGTLTLDVSPEGDVVYVHALYCHDPDELRKLVEDLDRRIGEVIG